MQVLCSRRKTCKGIMGLDVLNRIIQQEVATDRVISYLPVVQTRNDYEHGVFNGEIGRNYGSYIDFGEGRIVPCTPETLRRVELAFAITVHKSQGSEYFQDVVVVNPTDHRRLIYTAITRGKQRVVILGKRRDLESAIRREPPPLRTLIKEISTAV